MRTQGNGRKHSTVFERYTRWRFGCDGSPLVSLLSVDGLIDVPMEQAALKVSFQIVYLRLHLVPKCKFEFTTPNDRMIPMFGQRVGGSST
jgi:hypothetical protein